VEDHIQFQRLGVQPGHPAPAQGAPQQAHGQLVPGPGPVHLGDVPQAPPGEPDPSRVQEILVLEEQKVHGQVSLAP
jgi:hypothetical protein